MIWGTPKQRKALFEYDSWKEMNQPNTPPTTSPLATRPDLAPATLPAVRLDTCPFCGYSLEGLPSAARCPEFGLAYDENTYILRAITRGTSGMSRSRAAIWILVAVSAWLGMRVGPQFFILRRPSVGLFGLTFLVAAWSTLVLYLLITGKKHRGQKAVEHFIFCADGFGPCTLQHGNSAPIDADLTRLRFIRLQSDDTAVAGIQNKPGNEVPAVKNDNPILEFATVEDDGNIR